MKKQLIVICNGCKELLAFSKAMGKKEAEESKGKLVMNPFGAPRCQKCKGLEPYPDINLMHTIEIADYDKGLKL